MADLPRTVQHAPQVFCTLYPLNKSFTKKVIIGLEYDETADKLDDECYKPVVRLLSNDFEGVAFSCDDWEDFKTSFNDIDKYFRGLDTGLKDQKIYGNGWILKFTTSHQDKAIEIEEDRRPGVGRIKRFRHSLIIKKVTFDCLQEFIVKCVDTRLKYLSSIASSVRRVTCELMEFLTNKSSLMHEAQIQLYTSNIVKDIVNLVDDNVINDITSSIENQCKEEKLTSLSKSDVTDVLYQFVSLHMPRIIDVLNVKLSDNK